MPKYLAVSLRGICCPFNVTAGQVSRKIFKSKTLPAVGLELLNLGLLGRILIH